MPPAASPTLEKQSGRSERALRKTGQNNQHIVCFTEKLSPGRSSGGAVPQRTCLVGIGLCLTLINCAIGWFATRFVSGGMKAPRRRNCGADGLTVQCAPKKNEKKSQKHKKVNPSKPPQTPPKNAILLLKKTVGLNFPKNRRIF